MRQGAAPAPGEAHRAREEDGRAKAKPADRGRAKKGKAPDDTGAFHNNRDTRAALGLRG